MMKTICSLRFKEAIEAIKGTETVRQGTEL